MRIADKTLNAIDKVTFETQGGKYREALRKWLPQMEDAYRPQEMLPRGHLGASLLGRECSRQLWYGFRWAVYPKFPSHVIRLFNTGHLYEARFLALLESIGCTVKQSDEKTGKQFRINHGAFLGGSGDGIALGVPDVPAGKWCLLEFKTHNDASFTKLIEKGVRYAKPEHYVQMQIYMRKMKLSHALYMAMNKNDDKLHAEIIYLDQYAADFYINRGMDIIHEKIPKKISNNPDCFNCAYCTFLDVCHYGTPPEKNCRTCRYSRPSEEVSSWVCEYYRAKLSVDRQIKACDNYMPIT
jgi:hypothetical protein